MKDKLSLSSGVVTFFFKQGTPEFVTATDCVHYFEWRTTAACKKDIFKADKEVMESGTIWL